MGGAATGSAPAGAARDDALDLSTLLKILLVVFAVIAIVALLWPKAVKAWAEGAPKPKKAWTEDVLRRLEREGARRGRARRRGETVRHYTRALADGVLPDERIAEAGAALSDSIFGHDPVSPDTERWIASLIDEVVAAHPLPPRGERSRDKVGASA